MSLLPPGVQVRKLLTHSRVAVDKPRYTDPHVKANALLQVRVVPLASLAVQLQAMACQSAGDPLVYRDNLDPSVLLGDELLIPCCRRTLRGRRCRVMAATWPSTSATSCRPPTVSYRCCCAFDASQPPFAWSCHPAP